MSGFVSVELFTFPKTSLQDVKALWIFIDCEQVSCCYLITVPLLLIESCDLIEVAKKNCIFFLFDGCCQCTWKY